MTAVSPPLAISREWPLPMRASTASSRRETPLPPTWRKPIPMTMTMTRCHGTVRSLQSFGFTNDSAGPDTLRHLFVLLMGLGMRESSGKHCEGRDRSAHNTTAETAEAGLFQTSFNARNASPLLPTIFAGYRANPSGFLEIFKEGVRCSTTSLENFGSGDGEEFQRLSKACPAFEQSSQLSGFGISESTGAQSIGERLSCVLNATPCCARFKRSSMHRRR